MAQFSTEQIRNVAVLGHGGSGKTTLTEVLLHKTGAISRVGTVEDGSTTSDWDAEEQRRGISINLSVVPIEFEGKKVNLIDTPGYLDFVGQVNSALHIAESGLILVDSVTGAEVGTELAWDRLTELNKPRIIFVNKMDRENANFRNAVESLKASFGEDSTVLPFQLPIGEADEFKGVVNLANMTAYMGPEGKEVPIPDDMKEEAEAAHTAMVEAAAESDDELIMKYLDGEELTPEEVRRGIYQGVKNALITPVYCGSAITGVGLERVMKSVIRYTPSPNERPLSAEPAEVGANSAGEFAGIVFKTIIDRYVGRMNYVRVGNGTLKKDSMVKNSRTGAEQRVANLNSVCGKELTAVGDLAAGDIGVITKLDDVVTNDTLALSDVVVMPISYPQPLYGIAIEPATQADSAKLGQSLSSIVEEDPTLKIENVLATKQTVLQGMGETHVDVAVRSLETKFGVTVNCSVPKVAYQETISKMGSAQYRHKKQSGGAGQFAEVHMRVEPMERGEGFDYSSEVFGGAISQVFLPSIEKGVRQVMEQGVVAGYPIVDVKAVVYDGKEHPIDSKDTAFQTAGREAFKKAMDEAGVALLEPIYEIEVTVPEEYMGDVMGDFNTRRGRVQGMAQKNNRSVVKALVPQAEIMRYGTDLRSMTQGRGLYAIEFAHYEAVPNQMLDQIVAESNSDEGAES